MSKRSFGKRHVGKKERRKKRGGTPPLIRRSVSQKRNQKTNAGIRKPRDRKRPPQKETISKKKKERQQEAVPPTFATAPSSGAGKKRTGRTERIFFGQATPIKYGNTFGKNQKKKQPDVREPRWRGKTEKKGLKKETRCTKPKRCLVQRQPCRQKEGQPRPFLVRRVRVPAM